MTINKLLAASLKAKLQQPTGGSCSNDLWSCEHLTGQRTTSPPSGWLASLLACSLTQARTRSLMLPAYLELVRSPTLVSGTHNCKCLNCQRPLDGYLTSMPLVSYCGTRIATMGNDTYQQCPVGSPSCPCAMATTQEKQNKTTKKNQQTNTKTNREKTVVMDIGL